MPFKVRKVSSYEWPVKVDVPEKGRFKEETFTAVFRKISRSQFNSLIEDGDEVLVDHILMGWKGIVDEGTNICRQGATHGRCRAVSPSEINKTLEIQVSERTRDLQEKNAQITDAVTQTNVKVLAEAPAQSMAMVYQTSAHSISLAMENAQQAQGGLQQIGNAVTSSSITMIMNAAKKFEG